MRLLYKNRRVSGDRRGSCGSKRGVRRAEVTRCSAVPVLVHCEGPEHDLQPYRGLLEEQLKERRVAPYPASEHVAVDLEVH
jgi:hypothetical protein